MDSVLASAIVIGIQIFLVQTSIGRVAKSIDRLTAKLDELVQLEKERRR